MKQYHNCVEQHAALDECNDLSPAMIEYIRQTWRDLYRDTTNLELNEAPLLRPLLEQNAETGEHTVEALIRHVRGVLRNGSIAGGSSGLSQPGFCASEFVVSPG